MVETETLTYNYSWDILCLLYIAGENISLPYGNVNKNRKPFCLWVAFFWTTKIKKKIWCQGSYNNIAA